MYSIPFSCILAHALSTINNKRVHNIGELLPAEGLCEALLRYFTVGFTPLRSVCAGGLQSRVRGRAIT